MNEKDFDEIMKNILENPPDFPIDPKAKTGLLNLMEGKNSKPSFPLWMRYVAALLLIPIFVFGYSFYQQLNLAYEKINTLEEQLTLVLPDRTDTIIQQHFIYQRDTIIRVVYQKNPAKNYISTFKEKITYLNQNNPFNIQRNKPLLGLLLSNEGSLNETKASLLAGLATIRKEAKEDEIKYYSRAILYPIERRIARKLNPTARFASATEDDFPMPRMPMEKNNWNIQPTSFSIGPIFSFGGHELNLGKNEIAYAFGIRGRVGFGHQLSLIGGIERQELRAIIREESALNNLPTVTPYHPDDLFTRLEIEFTSLQFPIGFQYEFFRTKKIQPFLGGGIVLRKSNRESYKYEFETPAEEEYYLNLNLEKKAISAKTLYATAGLRMHLKPKWAVQMEGNYNFNWRSNSPYRLASIKTSLLYSF